MDEIVSVFIQECREQLAEMEAGLLRLEQVPDDHDNINAIFRAAHTIKGGSGVIECRYIEQFTHLVENVLNQLRNGIRKVSHISNEFARSCANYLGVPTVVVKLVSGSISLSDFAWPAVDEDMVVERAFQRMLSDPNVRPSLPRNAHKLPVPAKRAMVMMYADITGVDIFGVRQLPDIVHWLQRAAIVHDGHEGQAMEAKLHRLLMAESNDLAAHVVA